MNPVSQANRIPKIEPGANLSDDRRIWLMTNSDPVTAELLVNSAAAYAARATDRLFHQSPEAQQQFGEAAFQQWHEHFRQRLLELSAAIAEGEPRLFSSRVDWARGAFRARGVEQKFLQQSLVCLRDVLGDELPLSLQSATSAYLDQAEQGLKQASPAESDLDPADPNDKLALQYLALVLEGESHQAIDLVLNAVSDGLPVEHAYEKVLLLAQSEIGRMWHRAEISVAEEHYLTSTTLRVMPILCHQAPKQPNTGLTVLAAAVADNIHDVGVRAVSDFFEMAGWRAVCLGGNAPPQEIAQAAEIFDASLLLVSAALCTQIRTVRETIQAVRNLPENECKIMVGGMAFAEVPELWRKLGADGYAATASEALALGQRWTSA